MTSFDTISELWGIAADRLVAITPEEQSTIAAAKGMDGCPVVGISGPVRRDVVPVTVRGQVDPRHWEVLVHLQVGARCNIYAVRRGLIASLEDSALLWSALNMPIETVVDMATIYTYDTPAGIAERVRTLKGDKEVDAELQAKIMAHVLTCRYGEYKIFREKPLRFFCQKTGVMDYVRSRRALRAVDWGHRGPISKGQLHSEWRFCVAVLQLHIPRP